MAQSSTHNSKLLYFPNYSPNCHSLCFSNRKISQALISETIRTFLKVKIIHFCIIQRAPSF